MKKLSTYEFFHPLLSYLFGRFAVTLIEHGIGSRLSSHSNIGPTVQIEIGHANLQSAPDHATIDVVPFEFACRFIEMIVHQQDTIIRAGIAAVMIIVAFPL